MTVKELSQLYYINKEIAELKRQLEELEVSACSFGVQLTGMPKGNVKIDKVGDSAANIADIKALIKINTERCWHEKNRLERFINTIDSSEERLILRLRYINNLTWDEIGAELNYDESTVRKKHKDFLKKESAFSAS